MFIFIRFPEDLDVGTGVFGQRKVTAHYSEAHNHSKSLLLTEYSHQRLIVYLESLRLTLYSMVQRFNVDPGFRPQLELFSHYSLAAFTRSGQTTW